MAKQVIDVMHTFANNDRVPYLSWFAEHARRAGDIRFTFVFLHKQRPSMMDEMRSHGFRCIWVQYDDAHRKRGMIKALPQLWWHMMRLRPQVVHGHLFDDTLPAMVAAWSARIKLRLYTRQDSGFHWNYAPKWVFLDRLTARLATHIACVSQEVKSFMVEREGADPTKLTVVHHGIPVEAYAVRDKERMERLRVRFGLQQRYPIIGTVARFIAWKGYRHVVDAAKRCVVDHPNARFLFSGTGPQREEVERWVKEAGLEAHIIFTGWVDRQDVPSLFALMDVYLHAADHEPFGFVFAEAMAAAVPVVSTPTGAALDAITTGTNGVLVQTRTGEALAAGVDFLLRSDHKAIGKAGQASAVQLFSFERMWQGYREIYRNASGPTHR